MGYLDKVFDKIVTWFQENPGARRILPFASVALLVLGVLMLTTSFGPSEEPAPTVSPPTVTDELDKAVSAAQVFYADQATPTFEGFNPKTAEGTDASLTWNKSDTATDGVVSIRSANKNKVLLVSKDATGVYCVTASAKVGVVKGRVDAQRSADCTGGW